MHNIDRTLMAYGPEVDGYAAAYEAEYDYEDADEYGAYAAEYDGSEVFDEDDETRGTNTT